MLLLAGNRTEPAAASPQSVSGRQEWLPALSARLLNGTFTNAVAGDEQLVITDESLRPIADDVAARTRGNDVVGRVVLVVPVDVVREDRVPAAPAFDPSEHSATPVTRVVSWSEPVIEDYAVLLDGPVASGEGMPRPSDVLVSTGHIDSVSAKPPKEEGR